MFYFALLLWTRISCFVLFGDRRARHIASYFCVHGLDTIIPRSVLCTNIRSWYNDDQLRGHDAKNKKNTRNRSVLA